jgi:hypothetical protein
MLETIYAEEKLRELRSARVDSRLRRVVADPNAEVKRTGIGIVHEVFRRIVEDDGPVARPQRRLGWR